MLIPINILISGSGNERYKETLKSKKIKVKGYHYQSIPRSRDHGEFTLDLMRYIYINK